MDNKAASYVEREALASEMLALQQNFFVWTEAALLSECCVVTRCKQQCQFKSAQKVPLFQDINVILCKRCKTSAVKKSVF